MPIVYAAEPDLTVEDFVSVLGDTVMRDRRPLGNPERIRRMLAGADLIVTARDETGALLGLARCISDGEWVTYCAELAVRESAQGHGIGRALLDACYEHIGPGQTLLLVAFPEAVGFYERLGMQKEPAYLHARTIRE